MLVTRNMLAMVFLQMVVPWSDMTTVTFCTGIIFRSDVNSSRVYLGPFQGLIISLPGSHSLRCPDQELKGSVLGGLLFYVFLSRLSFGFGTMFRLHVAPWLSFSLCERVPEFYCLECWYWCGWYRCQRCRCQGYYIVKMAMTEALGAGDFNEVINIEITSARSVSILFAFFPLPEIAGHDVCSKEYWTINTGLSGLLQIITSGSKVTCLDCSSKCNLSGASLDLWVLVEKVLYTVYLSWMGLSSGQKRHQLCLSLMGDQPVAGLAGLNREGFESAVRCCSWHRLHRPTGQGGDWEGHQSFYFILVFSHVEVRLNTFHKENGF